MQVLIIIILAIFSVVEIMPIIYEMSVCLFLWANHHPIHFFDRWSFWKLSIFILCFVFLKCLRCTKILINIINYLEVASFNFLMVKKIIDSSSLPVNQNKLKLKILLQKHTCMHKNSMNTAKRWKILVLSPFDYFRQFDIYFFEYSDGEVLAFVMYFLITNAKSE